MALFNLSAPPFNWCQLKLARAREHFDAIKHEISAWENICKGRARLFDECNAEMTRYTVVVRDVGKPPVERWGLMAADCFHNLRVTLDQFLYAVAVYQSGQEPPPDADKLQFPICDAPKKFSEERVQRRIQSLSDPVRTAIERVQPYNRRHPHLPCLLTLLRNFDNTDKHRLLQVTLINPTQMSFQNIVGIAPWQSVRSQIYTNEVKDNTEVAALILDRPTPNVRYENFQLTMEVSIRHAPGPRGQDTTALVDLIGDVIAEVEAVMVEIYKVV